jgi:hypothetical protein
MISNDKVTVASCSIVCKAGYLDASIMIDVFDNVRKNRFFAQEMP